MFRYYGIAELAIVVSDIEQSLKFYVDLLGFETTSYDYGKHSAILKIGENRFLGLWEPGHWTSHFLSPEKTAAYFGNAVAPTHPVFAIHNDDIEPLAQKLKDAGYEIDGPMPHGDGALHLYVSDPDNHAIEFWGWREGKQIG
jgi:catechol 2,3-dioxygenase-like lactoylglutathione lyase family enzyme